MKLVLDTNVLFSAFATRGLSHAVFEYCLTQHEIVVSERILDELAEHLEAKIKLPRERIDEIRTFLREFCAIAEPDALPEPVCRDPDDDHVLGLATAGVAGCVVTGDQDLLVLKEYRSIPILTPREFWARERTRSGG